ncbi:MAG: short-chain dehydrogenase [Pelagibacterales bacterium]|nr:short-chain dehydrogenase [Pelagibacterales bacterium]|tara:strand:+ start:613 stop:1386 length:774 start_codon:yes stop_codon:yes gene_type:complete
MHELFNLENKAVVITGSSRGIGKGMAKRFSEFGAKLIISSRKLEACKEVEMEIIKEGGIAFSKECNISKKNHCEELVDFCIEKYGRLDVLICNAASNPYYGDLEKIPDELFDKIMNNNVKSNLWLCKKSIPYLKKRESSSIIIVSSIAGLQGVKNLGAYSISKTADIGLIRSLAVELGKFNININGLCPGIIKTDFARELWENPEILKHVEEQAPLGRIGTVDEVIGAAILLASKAGSFITGQVITMDGGVTIAGRG